jgi:hypothetical protein
MTRYRYLLAVFLVFTILTACSLGGPHALGPSPIPSPPETWTAKLTQSGGFAGVLRTIQVSSDGQFTARDDRSARSIAGALPPESLGKLDRLLAGIKAPTASAGPSGCADCFIYDLELTAPDRTVHIHVDDVSIEASGAQEVIAFLSQIRDSALLSAP